MLRLFTWDMAGNFTGAMPYGQALTGLRVLKFDGAVAPRGLKFDSGYAAEGCGGRL